MVFERRGVAVCRGDALCHSNRVQIHREIREWLEITLSEETLRVDECVEEGER